MARVVAIGVQDFEKIRKNDSFYVDKTQFIKEWWESRDDVTLITRPRRFGKTLNMSMLERFWSVRYAGQGEIFEGLSIWEDEKYRKLQGTYPVISLSFSGVKDNTCAMAIYRICEILQNQYRNYSDLCNSDVLTDGDKKRCEQMAADGVKAEDAPTALQFLSDCLYRHYGKKVLIFLDEYDTPMQEAYLNGYWEELVAFTRSLFNATFKSNPYLERAVMTGITRVSKESIFSDLNNLKVITTTSDKYASCFGFTEEEVFTAMDEFGFTNKDEVKAWYDGFTFGSLTDIYNPWSITSFLDEGKLKTYWADTSSNGLVGSLLKTGDSETKMQFEQLLQGQTITVELDEQIVFNQLTKKKNAVWSLLLASGYIKAVEVSGRSYTLALTNYEVEQMFEDMVRSWFEEDSSYNDFVKALLQGDLDAMNAYMERICESMFSSFDTGNQPSKEHLPCRFRFAEGKCVGNVPVGTLQDPERFYHGFVLGLLADLRGRYVVTSNRESGFGRYDVLLEPVKKEDDGIILEFKVYNPKREANLEETVQSALKQIEEKHYAQTLLDHDVPADKIRNYGFAFEGKTVQIGE